MAAQGPICIITPTGMICASSPMKKHVPGAGGCADHTPPGPQSAKAKKLRDTMADAGSGFSSEEQELVGQVVELMLAVPVKASEQFTIVYNRKP